MKAAIWTGPDKVEITELPMPHPQPGWALIKVRAAGVCVTDYHVISGKLKIGSPPNVQGHEICGEVVEINGASDIPAGTRCVIKTTFGCGECEMCRSGRAYLCDKTWEIGYTPFHGGYEEYLVAPIAAIEPIPDSVSDLAAAIMECCVCPTESLMRLGINKGETMLVTGNGPAALSFIMMGKVFGAGRVISVIRDPEKQKLVRSFGADEVIVSSDHDYILGRIKELTNGVMAPLVAESTGAPVIIERCFDYVSKGGRIIQYGICGDGDLVNLPVKKMVCDEITVYGTVGNATAWKTLIELTDKGVIDLEKMVTHIYRLDEINTAFDLYRNHDRKLIKAVVKFV